MDVEQNETTIVQTNAPVKRNKHIEAGVSGASIGYQALARKHFPILSQLSDVESFRSSKSEILSAGQIQILKYALSEEKMKKASFIALCQGFEILNKAERLELGKSTENINNRHFGNLQLEVTNE